MLHRLWFTPYVMKSDKCKNTTVTELNKIVQIF